MSEDRDWLAERLRWLAVEAKVGAPIEYRKEAAAIRLRMMLEVMK